MNYIKGAFTPVFFLLTGVSFTWAQAPDDNVQATLVADVSSVAPGSGFALGVLFEMKPGWHIYWHNPGESGLATSIRFELPEGVKAGPILWPAPTRFDQPGNILGYGYSGSVLLAAKLIVRDDLDVAGTLPIRAKARWLSCKDVCIPGSAELEMELPLSSAAETAQETLFAEWEESLPVEAFSAGVQATTAGSIPLDGASGTFVIDLTFKVAPTRVEWFPYADSSLRVTESSVATDGNHATVTFDAAVMKGQDLTSSELSSIVTFFQGDEKRAVRVPVPLRKGN